MKTFISAVFAALLLGGLANAQVTVIDDVFGDGNPETNTDGTVAPGIDGSYFVVAADGGVVTEGTGIPEVTESVGGPLKFNTEANGDWARGELISKHDFPLPTAGQSRSFNWTIGPITPININACCDDYRIQLSAINAARTQDTAGDGIGRDHEMFVLDGTGEGAAAIVLDMYFNRTVGDAGSSFLLGWAFEKDSTHPAASNGPRVGPDFDLFGWDWFTQSNTITLTMTDTGYTWSDSLTGFSLAQPYTTQIAADFAGGYWAFIDGQNRADGRGSGELSRFQVIETGIPAVVAGDFDGDGFVGQSDLDLVLLNWGDTSPPAPAGWVNEVPDGLIGQEALDGVLLNWGNGTPPSLASVPEPTSATLLSVGAGLLALRRRRK